ncbi:hypothetical protein J3E07_001644 [Methanococcus voltae]|uniref:Uncharacterized protein n=1 Tax=Methanococcus voltae TaxID=2188 RepID=A0A8J7S6A5_METVO|nr:hypothetical protein [Methanococcus voltae]MBP2202203.1 hypothetical protein [Methanococcus voltae]
MYIIALMYALLIMALVIAYRYLKDKNIYGFYLFALMTLFLCAAVHFSYEIIYGNLILTDVEYHRLFIPTLSAFGTFGAMIFAALVINEMSKQQKIEFEMLEETKKQREELELQRKELQKPELIVNLVQDKELFGFIMLYLENIGQGIAKDVEITFADDENKDIEDSIGNIISELPIFSKKINFLAPNQRKLLFIMNTQNYKDKIYDIIFKFNLTYKNNTGEEISHYLEIDLSELKSYIGIDSSKSIKNQLKRINGTLALTDHHIKVMSDNIKNLQIDFKMDDENIENFKNASLVLDKIVEICEKKSNKYVDGRVLKTELDINNDKLDSALEFLEKMGYLKLIRLWDSRNKNLYYCIHMEKNFKK